MALSRRSILTGLAAAPLLPRAAISATPLSIIATTGMIADAATAICGDLAEVRTLMGPGVDPHGYRQTRSDILAMTRADLVLWNGLYLEAQLEGFLGDLSRRVPVHAVAEAVPQDDLLVHQDYAGRADPHVWMVPELWSHVVKSTSNALTALRPEFADLFVTNEAAYQAEISAVGAYAKSVLSNVPQEARVLVTAHDAFGYFGRAYDFDVLGIQGISTESEAGLYRIRELVELIVDRGVGAVFVESSVSDRNVRALIEGAGALGHDVSIGGELFSDAMGLPGTYEGTYVGMIDHNVTTIARALGTDVPAGGMAGKLSGSI